MTDEELISDLQRKCDSLEYELLSTQAQRHHEVLCLVLKELVRGSVEQRAQPIPADHMRFAREYADLAYAPPKAEGT